MFILRIGTVFCISSIPEYWIIREKIERDGYDINLTFFQALEVLK